MDLKHGLVGIIAVLIEVVIGLSLTNTVASYSMALANNATMAPIVKVIAPFIPVIWIVGVFAMAGALVYYELSGAGA